ncbi:MAG: YraN family protein [Minisyncoccia bacterium]
MQRKNLGKKGEDIAERFLLKKGYEVLERNFKTKFGEIDIIAKKDGILIFVEVKTILENEDFFPQDHITKKKKYQLLKMAQIYQTKNKISNFIPYQIDIIGIIKNKINPKKNKIFHFKNAIRDDRIFY